MSVPGETIEIPRSRFAAILAAATLLGCAVASGVAMGMGGDSKGVMMAVGSLLIASIASLGPVVLRLGRENWGVGVLVFGAARSLLVLGVAWLMESNAPGVSKRALYLGAVAGAVVVLMIETLAAVTILSGIEARRAKEKSGNASGKPSTTAEHA